MPGQYCQSPHQPLPLEGEMSVDRDEQPQVVVECVLQWPALLAKQAYMSISISINVHIVLLTFIVSDHPT